MFTPQAVDVREFFFQTFNKAQARLVLTELEKMAFSVILEHQEYHPVLANRKKYLYYEWVVEDAVVNPFLHLSLHLSLLEQLSIDQPLGIKSIYQKFCHKFLDEHEAQHQLLECLAHVIWHAQKNKTELDVNLYLTALENKL